MFLTRFAEKTKKTPSQNNWSAKPKQSAKVSGLLIDFDKTRIDNLILLLPKRIEMVIKNKRYQNKILTNIFKVYLHVAAFYQQD